MIRCAPSSSGCSGSVGGPPSSTVTPRPAGLNMRSTRSSPLDAQAQLDHLEPEPGAHAREAVDDRARLGGREVDRRPGVEQQPVPVQALARRALRLERAHRLERLAHHPLELGQRGDAPVLVAHRREVAHLGERDQALVLRVLARLGAEQVDVLGRRHPLERELAQPPDVHPLGEHRVHAAQVGALLAVGARTCARRPPARARTRRGPPLRQLRLAQRAGEVVVLGAQHVDVGEHRSPSGTRARGRRARAARRAGRRARRRVAATWWRTPSCSYADSTNGTPSISRCSTASSSRIR